MCFAMVAFAIVGGPGEMTSITVAHGMARVENGRNVVYIGNIQKPQTSLDVNKIHTERQTHALLRQGVTISLLRFGDADDD